MTTTVQHFAETNKGCEMNNTPETDAVEQITIGKTLLTTGVVKADFARGLERERNELQHKLEICMAANSDVKRIAMERDALADALRVRLTGVCRRCGYLHDMEKHWENCPSYETENKLLTQCSHLRTL